MRIDIDKSEDLFVEYGKAIEGVLRRAVRQALLEHKRAGNSIASWERESVVLISPDKIPVDDRIETQQI
ncbi:MAG TPA: hypothetical protein VK619_01860 [Pyrinomonadaceae bacterium]|nr:hypothetical protein [Pyrinomonadaceae bacterium]